MPHPYQKHQPGEIVETSSDSYEILSILGEGGMGVVYKARQLTAQRIVALKSLTADSQDFTQIFRKLIEEAKKTSALDDHPNIVKVYALATSSSGPFLVMEYIEGETLAQVIERGSLSEESFYNVFFQILDALIAAHARGIVHRDIKPSNIIVTAAGTAKLMDFGIAKDLLAGDTAQNRTKTGVLTGSPAFMSPEQCRGERVDSRSDLYSLGCVMFMALTGNAPFTGESALDVMFKHIHDTRPELPATVPPALQSFIIKSLATDPAVRFQSAEEMLQALKDSRNGLAVASGGKRSHRRITIAELGLPIGLTAVVACASLVALVKDYSSPERMASAPEKNFKSAQECITEAKKLVGQWSTAQKKDPAEAARLKEKICRLLNQAIQERATDETHGEAYFQLAGIMAASKENRQASTFARKALELKKRAYAPTDKRLTELMVTLSQYEMHANQPAAALATAEQAFTSRLKADRNTASELSARCAETIANAYEALKDKNNANRYDEIAEKHFSESGSQKSPHYLSTLVSRGRRLTYQREYRKALVPLLKADAFMAPLERNNETFALYNLMNSLSLCHCYCNLKQYAEAEEWYKRASEKLQLIAPENSIEASSSLKVTRVKLLADSGNDLGLAKEMQQIIADAPTFPPEWHFQVLMSLELALRRSKRLNDALKTSELTQQCALKHWGATSRKLADARVARISALTDQGHAQQALDELTPIVKDLDSLTPTLSDSEKARHHLLHARLCWILNRPEEAAKSYLLAEKFATTAKAEQLKRIITEEQVSLRRSPNKFTPAGE